MQLAQLRQRDAISSHLDDSRFEYRISLIPSVSIFLVIGLVRILDEVLPGDIGWVYTLLGAIFLLLGLLLWSRRKPRVEES